MPSEHLTTNDHWYHSDGRHTAGPVLKAQVVALVREGTLTRDHNVRKAGSAEWVLVGMSEFARYLPMTVAPTPAPPFGMTMATPEPQPQRTSRATWIGVVIALLLGAVGGWWMRDLALISAKQAALIRLATDRQLQRTPFRITSSGWTFDGDYQGWYVRGEDRLLVHLDKATITRHRDSTDSDLSPQSLRAYLGSAFHPMPSITRISEPVMLKGRVVLESLDFDIPTEAFSVGEWKQSWLSFQLTLDSPSGIETQCYAHDTSFLEGTPIEDF